jgi:uncharacterized protein YjbI with pentapeptide repeats
MPANNGGNMLRASNKVLLTALRSAINGTRANFYKEKLQGVDFSEFTFESACFVKADLCEAKFNNAFLLCAKFIGANLSNATFENANCESALFMRANLQNAKLSKAKLLYADFTNADLRGADLRGANVYLADFTNADLRDADLRGTTGYGPNFAFAKLEGAKLPAGPAFQIKQGRIFLTVYDEKAWLGPLCLTLSGLLKKPDYYGKKLNYTKTEIKQLKALLQQAAEHQARHKARK